MSSEGRVTKYSLDERMDDLEREARQAGSHVSPFWRNVLRRAMTISYRDGLDHASHIAQLNSMSAPMGYSNVEKEAWKKACTDLRSKIITAMPLIRETDS